MAGRVNEVNTLVLKECREQAGFDLSDVKKKVSKIDEIEEGITKPTFKQLDTLSGLYEVPRWVFISQEIPAEFQFEESMPAFRQFTKNNSEIFNNPKLRKITARVEKYRELILNLLEDSEEPIDSFNPPSFPSDVSPVQGARIIRQWLDVDNNTFDFNDWKRKLETKGVFIFLTSKYNDWSHIDKMFIRGLSIYHQTLPIIIVNDSDSKKAQSFTLFHELCHLIKKESALDDWEYHSREIENWCDKIAGNVLMPEELFTFSQEDVQDLNAAKRIAMTFKVSPYAFIVRLRQLRIITQEMYSEFEQELTDEYQRIQEKLKASSGGPSRDRPLEIVNQFGTIFTKVLFQAYHNQEIGLHKLTKYFGLKRSSYVLDLEALL